jgi:hypothetical protein
MKIKQKTIPVLALILLLTISGMMAGIQTATAHDPPWEIPTYTYISASNNPIGAGQTLVLVFWANAVPVTAQGTYGDFWTFDVDVTKPDGSIETLGPFDSDPVGGSYALYTPDQLGEYTFVANFLEHTITGQPLDPRLNTTEQYNYAYWGDIYLASQSNPLTVTVQQEEITSWSETPLPDRYWTRPVNNINRGWNVLLGNWLSGAAQTNGPTTNFCYGSATESAHVLWATPMWSGGIMDQRFNDEGFNGGHYEGIQFSPPIILDGKIFYNVNTYPKEGWVALDLYTGEQLFFHNTTGPVTGMGGGFDSAGSVAGESLAFGQVYAYESPNQHGGFPYLWSTTYYNATTGQIQPNTWSMFDGYTGNYICSINNVPSWAASGGFFASSAAVYGQDGSILRYYIANLGTPADPNLYLQVWNTSQAIIYPTYGNTSQVITASNAYWMWRPTLNFTFDGNYGYTLNVSIPNVQGSLITVREGQYVIGGVNGKVNDTYTQEGNLWALNLDPTKGEIGSLLWNITYLPPKNVPDLAAGTGFFASGVSSPTVDPEDGVFIFNNRILLTWYVYNLTTGEPIWTSEPEGDFNFYGMYSNIYEGKLLSTGYSGVVTCYNITNGDVLWKYTAEQEGFESPYGNFPLYIAAIADGKIFTVSGEHSPSQPLWRGSYIRCIDADTGEEVWKILHWGAGIGGAHLTGVCVYMADSYVVGLNLYDNQIYCYGKGSSATSVNVQNDVVSLGSSVLITGTVTDVSPGAKNKIASGEFTTDPAVSDESQEDWMEYIYAQQAKPKDATGVPVSLYTLDPNGNDIHIADVISDASGGFKYLWTPDVPGEYTVTATFCGSAAYYGSEATTYVGVTPASAAPLVTPTPTIPGQTTPPTSTPTQPVSPSPSEAPQPTSDGEPTTTYIAIGVAVVIIVALVAVLVLRRRK